MGIFIKVKSISGNNYLKSPTNAIKSKIINMSTKEVRPEEREEGEIIDEFEDIISSDEEFSMRKRIEELEAKNAELEKIANISVSAVYASGGYNDYPKKDTQHPDRYPIVSIDISDDEDYPPAPKMPRISKRRKSNQHSSSRHKLIHTSSSTHRRRKRSSSPPPAPQYRQSDKLLLSLFHERIVAHNSNSHSSKRKRKTKKTHSTKSSRRKSREYYVSDTEEDYNNSESYNVDVDDNHQNFYNSDCDKSYSLNRDELRLALARNTHQIEQHASLKDRLTRKREKTDILNFVPSAENSPPPQERVIVDEEEQREKTSSPVEEKPDTDDYLEEQELRILALKSAVLKKHMVRKKRNENVAYSPSDFDEIYKCISESPSLNNIDEQENNSMEISPVPSPKMILSDDGGIDTKPVDMDIVNSDSECELPSYEKWIPIEQIPLPNSIGINEEIHNPTPIRYNNEQRHVTPPDVRYESVSVSPKNFDSEVDEEELALRALLLAKMNSPKVNRIVKEEPLKVVQVETTDLDVSMEAEALRNFLINNMKKKANPINSSASVLKEAVRRLTGKNNSPSPSEASNQSRYPIKTADETEMELNQAITDMAKVNIGLKPISEIRKNVSSSGGIRVRNIDTLRASQKFESSLDVQGSTIVNPKVTINQEKENSKENPMILNHQKNSVRKENEAEKAQSKRLDSKKVVKKETPLGMQITSNNVLKSVSSQNNKTTNLSKPLDRNLTVKIEKITLPNLSPTQNITLNPNSEEGIAIENASKIVDSIEAVQIKAENISQNLPNQRSVSDVNKNNTNKIVVENLDPAICVKNEKEADQANQSESNKSKLDQEIVDPQHDVDKMAINQATETILLDHVSIPRILDNVDFKQVEENLKENIPTVSTVVNKNQQAILELDATCNEVVEDVDPKQIEVTEIRQENLQVSVVENKQQTTAINSKVVVESTDASTNLKYSSVSTSDEIVPTENILNIVGNKDVEEVVLTNSSNTSLSENVFLKSVPEENLITHEVSKATITEVSLEVDPIETIETVFNQALLPRAISEQQTTQSDKDKSVELISKTNILQESHLEDSAIVEQQIMKSSTPENMIDIDSNSSPKLEVALLQHKKKDITELLEKPTGLESTSKSVESSNTFSFTNTRQVKLGNKSIEIQIQQGKLESQNVSKLPNTQKVPENPVETVEKPETSVKKSTLSTQEKTLSPKSSTETQKPITKLQILNQQPITNRTKIVKPNKIINQHVTDLKRKTIDNLALPPVSTKKPKIDDTSRLITTAEIPKVPELVIQLRASESESEYSELSAQDMEEDEDSRVRNFFNRSITIGNEYYDIASPISLPMESPCDTPTQSSSPIASRTQTPQPSVEKSIVNDYFEAKLEQFLKNVRSKVSVNTTKPTEFKRSEIVSVNSTPVAVRHLPEASQQEYRRLINRMKMLERQKQAKNLQVHVKTSDPGPSDVKTTITDSDGKFLVRKVLVKNATAKPSSSVIPKPPMEKTEKILENPLTLSKSVKSPQATSSPAGVSEDTSKSSSKQNLLVLYENSYRKTGTSIICNLEKSIEMVLVAKKAKMAKLKHEQRLKELRKQIEDVQKNLKEQQDKITKIYPEICNSHRVIESLKTRRLKINKAVTALGKSIIGPNYSMQNDQKLLISEKSKKLAAEIKFVNTMKLSDAKIMEDQNNLPDNSKKIIPPVQNLKTSIEEKLPTKSVSVTPSENLKTSLEVQIPANSLLEEQLPAHKNDEPPMATSSSSSPSTEIINNEVPACDSQSPEILNKPVPEDMENHVNNTIVPEIFSNKDDGKACSTTNGHEEALELEQPVAVGDNNYIISEQAPDQTNMDENNQEENGGEQVGSAKLQDYVSPLSHLRDERHINPNGVVCPYQLMGQCDDKDCKYMHLED